MPVDLYVGGSEHAVLHLLYARFWHKVLFDMGLVKTEEPFKKLVHQGLILGTSYRYFRTIDSKGAPFEEEVSRNSTARNIVVDRTILSNPVLFRRLLDTAATNREALIVPDIALLEMARPDRIEELVRQFLEIASDRPSLIALAQPGGALMAREFETGLPCRDVIDEEATWRLRDVFASYRRDPNEGVRNFAQSLIGARSVGEEQYFDREKNRRRLAAMVDGWEASLTPDELRGLEKAPELERRRILSSRSITRTCYDALVGAGCDPTAAGRLAVEPSISSHLFLAEISVGLRRIHHREPLSDRALSNEFADAEYVALGSLCRQFASEKPSAKRAYKRLMAIARYRGQALAGTHARYFSGATKVVRSNDPPEIRIVATNAPVEELWAQESDVETVGNRTVHRTRAVEVVMVAEKMSKSRGNVVNPDDIVKSHGADALRLYEMFMGPLEAVKPWQTSAIEGVRRFLDRVWNVCTNVTDDAPGDETKRLVHKTIKKVTEDIEHMRFNTAISAMMILVKHLGSLPRAPRESAKALALLVSPFAPHIGEELWQRLGAKDLLAYEPWPTFDPDLVKDDVIEIGVQVNGKARASVQIAVDADEETAKAAALADPKVQSFTNGKTIKKVIYVKGRILNLIVA